MYRMYRQCILRNGWGWLGMNGMDDGRRGDVLVLVLLLRVRGRRQGAVGYVPLVALVGVLGWCVGKLINLML